MYQLIFTKKTYLPSINFYFLSNSYLIMQQYGQVAIFIEWLLKIDGFTVGALPV